MTAQPSALPWHRGLWDCFAAPGTCIYGFFCLPCLYGRNVDREEGSSCVLNCLVYYALAHFCLQWVVQYNFRQRLRSKYGLEEEPCSDCCVAFCAGPCAICQEAQQTEHQALTAGTAKGLHAVPPQPQYMQS